jgi:hypothetical protein
MAGQQQVNGSDFDASGHLREWQGFTSMMKWSVIAVIALLVLMAIFLL